MGKVPLRPLKQFAAPRGLVGGPFGSNLGKRDYVDVGVPVIRGQNFSKGNIFSDRDFVYVSPDKVDRDLLRNLALPGDVVFTQRGTLGQVAVIPTGRYDRYVVSQSQMRMRVDPIRADASYIYYCFRDPNMVAMIRSRAIATGVPHINLGILGDLPIPDHPIVVQRAIAEVLGALDNRILFNDRLRATSFDLARALYDASSMVTSIRLGEVVDVFDGPHATPEKTEEGPWFLSISSLKDGFLDLEESAHLAEEDFARWTRRVQPEAGDVLLSYETRLGSAALMPPGVRGCLGRRMALLRTTSESVSGALILHAYLSPRFQEEIRRRAIHGATVDRIPLKELPAWPISLPIAENRAKLSAKLESLHSYVAQTLHENRTLAELRDTLLPKLMSGEICVKDAEQVVEEAV